MSEMFIKMYGLGTRPYFHSSFNCFDCGVSALVSKEFIPQLMCLEWLIPGDTPCSGSPEPQPLGRWGSPEKLALLLKLSLLFLLHCSSFVSH